MRTAFLILAHSQPEHLARLVRMLDTDWATFFVHVDAKIDDRPFRAAVKGGNVVFLQRRHKVNWGGFNMIKATLSLLHTARGSGVPFSRYCLMSGSDFPIKPVSRIMAELSSDRQFMRVDRKLNFADNNPFCDKVRYYWFCDSSLGLLNRLGGGGAD